VPSGVLGDEAVKDVDGGGPVLEERRPGDLVGEVPLAPGTSFLAGVGAAEPG
jgi:hypothetical protein